eukprot:851794-Ditylum_brightwellii.AAC.1
MLVHNALSQTWRNHDTMRNHQQPITHMTERDNNNTFSSNNDGGDNSAPIQFSTHAYVANSTGIVRYSESLTDPSYQGQILTLTSPMVGNYGVPNRNTINEYRLPAFFESTKIHARGLLCQDYSHQYSHWNSASSLGNWLKEVGIPGLCDINTAGDTAMRLPFRNHVQNQPVLNHQNRE